MQIKFLAGLDWQYRFLHEIKALFSIKFDRVKEATAFVILA